MQGQSMGSPGAILPKSIMQHPATAGKNQGFMPQHSLAGGNSFNANTSNGFSAASWKQSGVGQTLNRDDLASKDSGRRPSNYSQERQPRGSSLLVDYHHQNSGGSGRGLPQPGYPGSQPPAQFHQPSGAYPRPSYQQHYPSQHPMSGGGHQRMGDLVMRTTVRSNNSGYSN